MFAAFEWFTNNILWGLPLLLLCGGLGLYLTIGSGFFQFRAFGKIIKAPFSSESQDSKSAGKRLSSFEAVSVAIGGSVGVSNISGVGTAIATGGPGALFWLWIAALLGMMTKMAEATLAVHYRSTAPDGEHFGGPTYYMEKGLGKEKGWGIWKPLAIIFGLGIFMTFFITLQNYTTSEAIGSTFNLPYWIPGLVLVLCIYAIILGGLKKVGSIASYLVPIMCVFYVGCVIVTLVLNASEIPNALAMVFKGAFTTQAAAGGFAGATMIAALRTGFARAVYSNEAGWGTSPMVHATANVNHPIKQGFMGGFEVFMDTIVVCTATGLLVITTGYWNSGITGAELTLTALEANIGSFARIAISLSIFFFALTTATGWYTYYLVLLNHAFKEGPTKKLILKIYNATDPIFGYIFTLITVFGGGTPAEIWVFADFSSAIPTFVNCFVLLVLSGRFFELLKDYKARYMGIGQVDPNFAVFYEDKK